MSNSERQPEPGSRWLRTCIYQKDNQLHTVTTELIFEDVVRRFCRPLGGVAEAVCLYRFRYPEEEDHIITSVDVPTDDFPVAIYDDKGDGPKIVTFTPLWKNQSLEENTKGK